MSVGFAKRLLTLLNLAAVLALAGTGYGWWSHNSSLGKPWKEPDFGVPVKVSEQASVGIDNIPMRLGTYPRAVAAPAAEEAEEAPVENIQTALDKLGKIKSAVVAYPPYDYARPAIVFEANETLPGAQNKIVTISLGQALVTKPHPDAHLAQWGERVPSRYKFVGCEPDPEHPGWTFFLFDMACDGTDIQKARWKGESEHAELPNATKGEGEGLRETRILRGLGQPRPAAPEPPPETVEAVPAAPPPVAGNVPRGTLFEDDGGAFAPTDEGIEYLRDNYEDLLRDARTATYRDPSGNRSGVHILAIRRGSVASQFGILDDDVILKINGNAVSSQAQAVNVTKAELRQKKRYIEVEILRNGRTITQRYDTRDAATRRAARDAVRNRR